MAQRKASLLEACKREDGARVDATAHGVSEPNAGAVLRAPGRMGVLETAVDVAV